MYNKTILDNQLRVVTEYIPSNTVSVGVWVDVGSRDESLSLNGCAHFVEHMLFKGTSSLDANEIAKELDSLGGMSNAFTSKETTCLYGTVLESHVDQLVTILADLLQHSLFSVTEFERERQVVLQEISMVDDTPEDQIHDHLAATVWRSHPLAWPVLGTAQTVSNLTAVDLIDFVKRFYTADRIVIAAAGNVEHSSFVETIAASFGELATAAQSPQVYRLPPAHMSARDIVYTKTLEQAHLLFSAYCPPGNDPARYQLALLNVLLGGNMSSRLFQELREQKGLAYSIYSFVDAMSDAGTLSIYAGVGPQNIEEASTMIYDVVAGVKKNITRDEVDRARNYVRAGMYLASESMEARMTRLAKNEFYFDCYYTLEDVDAALVKTSRKDVLAVVEEVFAQPMTSVVLGPVEGTAA
nr:insulinase family protein [Desulfobulbaceae bacterium]